MEDSKGRAPPGPLKSWPGREPYRGGGHRLPHSLDSPVSPRIPASSVTPIPAGTHSAGPRQTAASVYPWTLSRREGCGATQDRTQGGTYASGFLAPNPSGGGRGRGEGYVTGGAGGGAGKGSQWGRPLLGIAWLFRPQSPEQPPPRPSSPRVLRVGAGDGRTPGESVAGSRRRVRRGRGCSPAGEPPSPEAPAGSPGPAFGAPSLLPRSRLPQPLCAPAGQVTSHLAARSPLPPPPRSPGTHGSSGPAPPLPRRARLPPPLPGGGSRLPPLALTSSGLASLLFISASGSPADGCDGRRQRGRPGGPHACRVQQMPAGRGSAFGQQTEGAPCQSP